MIGLARTLSLRFVDMLNRVLGCASLAIVIFPPVKVWVSPAVDAWEAARCSFYSSSDPCVYDDIVFDRLRYPLWHICTPELLWSLGIPLVLRLRAAMVHVCWSHCIQQGCSHIRKISTPKPLRQCSQCLVNHCDSLIGRTYKGWRAVFLELV